jgi:uracil-DNA glycosylase
MHRSDSQGVESLPPAWREPLAGELDKDYFRSLTSFLNSEYQSAKEIYPPRPFILRALSSVDFAEVKVVILGQDPYHGPGQAIGLSFGVPNEMRLKPPSLKNIFKELATDMGSPAPAGQSDLTGWAEQGVLLLNTALTVRRSEAFSHRGQGWETFTDEIIRRLNERESPLVFLLWGAAAISKKKLVTNPHHRVIESVHPSPLSASRGFFGSKPFSRTNQFLLELGHSPINWLKVSTVK